MSDTTYYHKFSIIANIRLIFGPNPGFLTPKNAQNYGEKPRKMAKIW